jgi:hypothetical protein
MKISGKNIFTEPFFRWARIFPGVVLLLCLSFPLLSNAATDSKFYTGLWEYTIDIKMQAMPQSELKKVRECIKELNEVINLFKPDPSCSVSQVQADTSHLSWKLYCKTAGGTYYGDAGLQGDKHALHGRVELQTVIPGMKNMMSTSYIISGINKGTCQ